VNCRKTILLVEDSSQDADLTRRALAKSSILNEVIVVADGQQALDYLRGDGAYRDQRQAYTPTLVLLDLKLPKLSGLDLLRAIRADQRLCRLPVVILTGSPHDEDVLAGYHLGVNSYVRKPIDVKEFQVAIESIGLYWLFVNEPDPLLNFCQ
jgi:DNA-binding response OmpR family regulator